MIDLNDFRHRYVTGWGDRMTVGVQVADMRELLEELESLRDRHRHQTAALDAAQVQVDYWHRMAHAMQREAERHKSDAEELRQRYSDPPPSGER